MPWDNSTDTLQGLGIFIFNVIYQSNPFFIYVVVFEMKKNILFSPFLFTDEEKEIGVAG